jgi:hypothetical protein
MRSIKTRTLRSYSHCLENDMPLPTAAFLPNSRCPSAPAPQLSAPSRASPPTSRREERVPSADAGPEKIPLHTCSSSPFRGTEPHRRESEMSLSHHHGRRTAGRPNQLRPFEFVLPARTLPLCIFFFKSKYLFVSFSTKLCSCEASYCNDKIRL